MKKLIVLFIIFMLVGAGYFVLREDSIVDNNRFQKMDLRIEFIPEEGIESQEIRILNQENKIIFQLTINDLNQWTEENWNVFKEAPEVGNRAVDPAGFGFFDRAVSISPDNERMVFSVSDYAVATTISFIIVVDIESGEMRMINTPARGSVENYFWSKDYKIAYTLGTARSRGDFLLVDDANYLERYFILGERDILEALDPYEELVEVGQFMPVFRDLQWLENKLYFTTDHLENNQVRWSINKDGTDLKIEDD